MKVLVFGNGWLGNMFSAALGGKISRARIENSRSVSWEIEEYRPDVVINTAGKPSADYSVDWCLDNQSETVTSNVVGPGILASVCRALNVPRLVQLSSGCIFDGYDKEFTEEDEPKTVNFYGETKVAGEAAISRIYNNNLSRVLMLRFRMPIHSEKHNRNLITKLLNYSSSSPIINTPNSITVVEDLLDAAATLIRMNKSGIYHVANPQVVTHRQILELCVEHGLKDALDGVEFISAEEFNQKKLTRDGRSNCILSVKKLKREGIVLRDTEEALKDCIARYKRSA